MTQQALLALAACTSTSGRAGVTTSEQEDRRGQGGMRRGHGDWGAVVALK